MTTARTALAQQRNRRRRLRRAPGPMSEMAKRLIDLVGAAVGLFAFLPLMAVVAVGLMASGGPVLFKQPRIGRGGRLFDCLKFRSMAVNGDEILARHLATDAAARAEWDRDHKLRDDPRVTRLGRFIRKTSVDELPQLINVLRGEMSLVGPRPIVQAEVCRYGVHIRHYHRVRPGLTGLWQVLGRSDVSYPRRVAMDTAYVRSRTLSGDIALIMRTIPAVIMSKGSY